MIHKDKFVEALSTLLHSWGGDTPPEATWAANELLDFYEAETGHVMGFRLVESGVDPFEEDGVFYIDNFETIRQGILDETV
jgi:hypothetical protein